MSIIMRLDTARAHLLYGEWLRRHQRRVDAREERGMAPSKLSAMGAEGFAERARHALVATGAEVRQRSAAQDDELTPQEAHITRLAGDGQTNVQIGAQLYLSPRTLEWHLKTVFLKLEVTLPQRAQACASGPERTRFVETWRLADWAPRCRGSPAVQRLHT
jgi:DNA-binding CsgD family transcriptional regulator